MVFQYWDLKSRVPEFFFQYQDSKSRYTRFFFQYQDPGFFIYGSPNYIKLPPPRTGGATSLTGLALGFWAPRYGKFSTTTGTGLALPPRTLPSPPH